MGRSLNATATSGALTVQAFVGDGCTLLAFDVRQGATDKFAGFAIKRTTGNGPGEYIGNLLNFADELTQDSSDDDVAAAFTTSDRAPFQKYRWIDFPSDANSGTFTYQVETRFFDPDEKHLKVGDTVTLSVTLGSREGTKFHVGFTRGYMSSQAYARDFENKAFRPAAKNGYLFDSKPYEKQWAWLGYHARQMLFDFLDVAKGAAVHSVDAFVYDVDEPDFVKRMMALGKSKAVRVILDDSKEGGKPKPDRTNFAKEMAGSAKATVLRTHFKRFAHDKVLILRDSAGKAVQVLCGSANFSIRGLYVQGNSVIVIDDPDVAAAYGEAFDDAWHSASTFASQPVATSWFRFHDKSELPDFAVSFAPHKNGEFALKTAENAITAAGKVVIFALMSPGGGQLIADLKKLASNQKVFTFGVLQTAAFATQLIQGGGESKGDKIQNEISSFAPLATVVPQPFLKEFSGGDGQVIHHKFVVVDFNGASPVVFCGSSNLTSGGESANGDNLLAINDREIATLYAIEGIRLADHYRFRDKLKSATKEAPMTLQGPGAATPWFADYYVEGTAKYRSRVALVQ
jgi:hypothetical protein